MPYKGTARAEPDRRVVITITDFKKTSTPAGMISVPGGCFQMGDTFGEGDGDEKPVHEVCLDGFYMDTHEVTNSEFESFKPSFTKSRSAEYEGKKVSPGDRHPVVRVTWGESKEYCQSQGKRLPTEAEWEYAARGGGKQYKYSWGNGEPSGNISDETAKQEFSGWTVWDGYRDGFARAAPVGEFRPNELGLYDMTGNVWEWASDWYGEKYYGTSPKNNPQGPSGGKFRVLHGGSWFYIPNSLRAAARYGNIPSTRYYNFGFRCVRSVQ